MSKIEIENITLIQASKKRMLKVIEKNSSHNANTGRMGFIFGIIDISLGQERNNRLYDIINEGINRYYRNDLDTETAYDDMINFLNRRAIQFIPEKDLKEKCNIAIGVLKDIKILFCVSGEISAYLSYPQGIKKIFPEEGERTMNITNKLFAYSLNGDILKNHNIFFCNTDFNSAINPHYLGKTLIKNQPKKVIEQLKEYFLELDSNYQYNSLFIYNNDDRTKDTSEISVEKMLKNERETEEHLSPSLLSSIKKTFKKNSISKYFFTYLFIFSKKILTLIKKIVLFVTFLLFNTFYIITNLRGKRKEKQLIINNKFKAILVHILDFYRSLTIISKLILTGIVSLFIIFGIATSYSLHIKNIKELKAVHQGKMETAKNLYNEADSDLLFKEKNVAVKKLKMAVDILDEIPEKIHDSEYDSLLVQIKNRLYEIQNIKEVSSPVLIADFTTEENLELAPILISEENKITVLSQNEIINIDISSQKIDRSNLNIGDSSQHLLYYYPDRKSIYILKNSDSFQIIDIKNISSKIKEITKHNNEKINKFAIYNDNLYSLSSNNKSFSFWKHNPSISGFGKPSLWITDNTPENTSPLSFAIDGNLYILFSNNEIFKYYRGMKTDWAYDISSIDKDVLYNKIITNDGYEYIYLLGNNRVSIISKNGEFMGHYILPTLSNIKNIAINEQTKTIYILDEKRIYAFSYNL